MRCEGVTYYSFSLSWHKGVYLHGSAWSRLGTDVEFRAQLGGPCLLGNGGGSYGAAGVWGECAVGAVANFTAAGPWCLIIACVLNTLLIRSWSLTQSGSLEPKVVCAATLVK